MSNKRKAVFDCPCGEKHNVNFGKGIKTTYLCQILGTKFKLIKFQTIAIQDPDA